MADKRIHQLDDAAATTDRYVPVDKSGNTEAERYPLSSLLPQSIYRFNTFSVASGEQTITFLEAFPVATVYDIQKPIAGLTADGDIIWAFPYDQTISGFKINFGTACTGTYIAIIIR